MQLVSASTGDWRQYHRKKKKKKKKRNPAVGVNSHRTKTQRCSCENATLQLCVLNCNWMARTMLLQTPFSSEIEVCRYLDALVDCWLPSTWASSQLQLAVDFGYTKRQYERRINCKINVIWRPCELSLEHSLTNLTFRLNRLLIRY